MYKESRGEKWWIENLSRTGVESLVLDAEKKATGALVMSLSENLSDCLILKYWMKEIIKIIKGGGK